MKRDWDETLGGAIGIAAGIFVVIALLTVCTHVAYGQELDTPQPERVFWAYDGVAWGRGYQPPECERIQDGSVWCWESAEQREEYSPYAGVSDRYRRWSPHYPAGSWCCENPRRDRWYFEEGNIWTPGVDGPGYYVWDYWSYQWQHADTEAQWAGRYPSERVEYKVFMPVITRGQ